MKFNYDMSICILRGGDWREGEGRGREVVLRRSKRRRYLPEIRTFFCGQTDILVYREVTLPITLPKIPQLTSSDSILMKLFSTSSC